MERTRKDKQAHMHTQTHADGHAQTLTGIHTPTCAQPSGYCVKAVASVGLLQR